MPMITEAMAYFPINVSGPPKYQPDGYGQYRKELLRRKDIHCGAHDSQLVGTISIKGEGLVESSLAQFMEETRNAPPKSHHSATTEADGCEASENRPRNFDDGDQYLVDISTQGK